MVFNRPPVSNPALLALPRRDLVYQVSLREVSMPGIEDTRTNAVGMVNADGSGQIIVAVQKNETYLHAPRIDPDLNMILYLTSGRPDSTVQGELKAYKGGILQRCSIYLEQRPSRVGPGARYVGVHSWEDEGGIVLFDYTQTACQMQELFTPKEMKRLGVCQVTGFHTEEKLLLIGKRFYVYDLSTKALQEIQLPEAQMCRLSPSDRFVACLFQEGSYEGVWLRVFRIEDGVLLHEQFIEPQYMPSFSVFNDLSWSPSEDALAYHHCVYPDRDGPLYSCQFQGPDNLGIYIWDLETGEEHLVVIGGIMPYWIDWNDAPVETPDSP